MILRISLLIGFILVLSSTAEAQINEVSPNGMPPVRTLPPTNPLSEEGSYNPLLNCQAPEDLNLFQSRLGEYQESLKNNPKNPKTLHQSGILNSRLQQWDEAQKSFFQALTFNKDDSLIPKIYRQLGDIYACQQQFDKAIDQYKKAIRSNSQEIDAKHNLALTQLLAQQQKEQQKQENKESSQEGSKDQQGKNQQSDEADPKQNNNTDKEGQTQEQPSSPQSNEQDTQEEKSEEQIAQSPSSNEEEPPPSASGSGEQEPTEQLEASLSQIQAEQLLNSVSENRKNYIQRLLKRQPPPPSTDKNW